MFVETSTQNDVDFGFMCACGKGNLVGGKCQECLWM
jgi:hypothetical protein